MRVRWRSPDGALSARRSPCERRGRLHAELEEDGQPGRFFVDTFMWTYTYKAAFKPFVLELLAARITARMTRASKVNIFYDQLLIKARHGEAHAVAP